MSDVEAGSDSPASQLDFPTLDLSLRDLGLDFD